MDDPTIWVINQLTEEQICEHVFADLQDPASSARAAAVYTLRQYGGRRAIALLRQALADGDAVVREEAADALCELDDVDAIELLLDIRNHDPDQEVRRTATTALQRLRYFIAQDGMS